jgi:hypothetical protein
MLLILHLVSAFGSMLYTAYLYFFPSAAKLKISYGLVAATFATGFGLVFTKPAHIVEVCVMGLVYLSVVSVGIVSAKYKLARVQPTP